MIWYVYILFSASSNSYYTGITTDLERRLGEHNTSPKGAKRTKAGRPWALAYSEGPFDRREALQREYRVKQMTHATKKRLVSTECRQETTQTTLA